MKWSEVDSLSNTMKSMLRTINKNNQRKLDRADEFSIFKEKFQARIGGFKGLLGLVCCGMGNDYLEFNQNFYSSMTFVNFNTECTDSLRLLDYY